jgi:transposase
MAWRSGQPYAAEFRQRVLRLADDGRPAVEVAVLLRISVSYIYTALARRRDHGETEARCGRGRKPPKLGPHAEALAARVRGCPDATLAELRTWLAEARGVEVSMGCLWNTLGRLQLTHKKSRSTRRSKSGPMSPRRAWPGAPPSPC